MKNYKVMVVGNPSSLKNSLIRSIVSGKELRDLTSACGTDLSVYTVNQTNFNIWNCIGKTKFGRLGATHYADAKFAIIVEGGEETPTPLDYKTSIIELNDSIPIHTISGSFEEMKEKIFFIFNFYSGTCSTLLDD